MEITDCDKCKYRKGCPLAWDYGSLYCNDYEEEKIEYRNFNGTADR